LSHEAENYTIPAFVAVYVRNTTVALDHLINLHRIEDTRQQFITSIQTGPSDFNFLPSNLDHISNYVKDLANRASQCSTCHHVSATAEQIKDLQLHITDYQQALDRLSSAPVAVRASGTLKRKADAMGNDLLERTKAMSVRTNAGFDLMTKVEMRKIERIWAVLSAAVTLTLLLGALVAVRLMRSITGPLSALVTATRMIAAGDLGYTLECKDGTEFGELTKHFNMMSRSLKKSYDKLEQEISERTATETELKKSGQSLKESEERYALAARGANDGLWDWDLRNNKIHYSCRWKAMLGYDEPEIGEKPEEWFSRVNPHDRDELEAKIAAHLEGRNPHFEAEYRVMHRNGTYLWLLNRGLAVRNNDGKAYRMAGSLTDITSRKKAEEHLLHDAFHDALTGLPNRALCLDRIEHAISAMKRRPESLCAVLFLDMDRFKTINDSLGHAVGDLFLISVGRKLVDCVRPGDTVARLGGDEFVVLLENIGDLSDALEVVERIRMKMSVPLPIKGHKINTSVSIGIALGSDRYERPEQVLRDADIAMYRAKARDNTSYELFDSKMHAGILERLQLESDLRRVLERRELVLFYQPIIHLKTQRLAGFETFVRWHHPTRGLLSPLEFIPLAEENGQIATLGEWIFGEACRGLIALQQQYPMQPPLTMSINISAKQFVQPDMADRTALIVTETGVDPRNLVLDITESAIMENVESAVATMHKLRDMGMHIHIDDFGTGYSSLGYLHRFPVNSLKIDRSFINGMTIDGRNNDVILSIMSLAKSLNFEVIAEGVEREHHLRSIKDLQCQYGQGYLFAAPMEQGELEGWLRNEHVHASAF
jgi:diguanylate cyclase (GGDEF)-like protein/PAS domain S-box-containing protein